LKGGSGVSSINPFFTESHSIDQQQTKREGKPSNTPRQIRSEKRHNVKFPITDLEYQSLKIAFKQAAEIQKRKSEKN